MKKYVFLVILIIASIISYGQNTSLRLKGESLKGKNIRLSYIDDRISFAENLIANKNLSEYETETVFNFTIEDIKELIIRINAREFHFPALPGTNYTLNVLPYTDSVTSFIPNETVPVEFSMEKDDNINFPIEDVFTELSDFLADNERMLQIKDSASKIKFDSLQNSLKSKYSNNRYISDYIDYEFASIKYAFRLNSDKRIKSEYFQNRPILYDNIGYMDCFNTVFGHYFSQGYKYVSRIDIENWLDMGNYNAFNDALGRDSVLKNEVFRELVFLSGMKDAFLDGYFSRERILSMLNKFQSITKFEKHKQIARNLVSYLKTRDFYGSKINTNLQVKDIDGNIKQLNDYTDKTLLLCFVKLDNTASLKELETIHFYYDSIKDNCNILTICFDNNFEKLYNFIKQNKVGKKYKWDFVHFNNNWDFVQQYGLHFFPHFAIIDKEGNILSNPAGSPSQGSLRMFFNEKQTK